MSLNRIQSALIVLLLLWSSVSFGQGIQSCRQLFQFSVPQPSSRTSNFVVQKLRPPVKQCLGTCYIESTIQKLRYYVDRLNPNQQYTLSRGHSIALFYKEVLQSYLKDSLMLLQKQPNQKESALGIVDIISDGTVHEVFNQLIKFQIPLTRNLTLAETRQQDQRIRGLFRSTLTELKSIRSELIDSAKTLTPQAEIFVEQATAKLSLDFLYGPRNEIQIPVAFSDGVDKYYPVQLIDGRPFPRHAEKNWWDTLIEINKKHLRYLEGRKVYMEYYDHKDLVSVVNDIATLKELDLKLRELVVIATEQANAKVQLHQAAIREQFDQFIRAEDELVYRDLDGKSHSLNMSMWPKFHEFALEVFARNGDENERVIRYKEPDRVHEDVKVFLRKYGSLSIAYYSVFDFYKSGVYDVPNYQALKVKRFFLNPKKTSWHTATVVGLQLDSKGDILYLEVQQMEGTQLGQRGTTLMSWEYFLHFAHFLYGY
ncbi:MAG: hypothetical protein R2827_16195 [Bdellovibrionales bacterium]